MNTSDRGRDAQLDVSTSGRERNGEMRSWSDDRTSPKYGMKREREDSRLEREGGRKKSRSRSPWEDKSPPGQAARLVGSSDPDQSQSRHSSRDPASQSDRPMEKRTRSEPLLREAGEIADDRHQRRHRNEERSHRCRALSVSSQEQMETANAERTANNVPAAGDDRRTKEGTVGLPPAPRRPDSSPSRGDRRGPSSREGRRTPVKGDRESQQKPVTPPRLTAIPAEIRKAALEAQKREQERQAAVAAALRNSDEEGGDLRSSGSKHTPIVWNGSVAGKSPAAEAAPQSAAETAALELEAFKRSQQLEDFDANAPPAMKASPSLSGSEEGETRADKGHVAEDSAAEDAPQMGMKSRWLVDDEEEARPAANGKSAAEEQAEVAALNEREQADMETAEELAGAGDEKEWESDDDSMSDFQATRRDISMLNSCRRVESFERLNRISEGTYGVVYRARDKQTGVICALKRIKMEKEKEGFPLTSIREINILLSFQHKNIVDVSEVVVGDSLDQIFMVMEFMEHDLKGLMDDMTQPFTVAETKNLMQQLLEGMAYLHSNWVLHRDLKSSNILYNNRGQLKICDFGLARQYGSPLRPYTHNVVTLYYRAIELLLGCEQYSTAIDMWSLGCIMAELLTKRVLFQGTGELDQIDKIFKVTGSPTEETWPGYKKLPNVQKIKLRFQPRTLRDALPVASKFDPTSGLTEVGLDLIEQMLTLDPAKRISAQDALNHPWFKEQPWPKDNALMPTYPTSKDGVSRSGRQRAGRVAATSKDADIGGPNFATRKAEIGLLFGSK